MTIRRVAAAVRGRLRRLWMYLPSIKVLVAATIAGLVSAAGILAGTDDARQQIGVAVAVGVGAFIGTILVEGAVRNAVGPHGGVRPVPRRQERQRTDDPSLPTGTGSLKQRLFWFLRLAWLRRRVRSEIAPLPGEQAIFRRRGTDIDRLKKIHTEARKARTKRWPRRLIPRHWREIGLSAPVTLFLHGNPGCGKSETAIALAHRLANDYPNGCVYINMGTAGGAKPAAEILKVFLDALKWPAAEIPRETHERAKVLRSLTAHRRLLFVLDATRDQDQLMQVMPVGAGCAVIVTSRRDLSRGIANAQSYFLEEPDDDESIDILRAAARQRSETRSEAAHNIVRYCGNLPLALRSAGERVGEGADLADVAEMLHDEDTRLDYLDNRNRKVRDRVSSEYVRLMPAERTVLQWLTLIPSSAFDAEGVRHLLEMDLDEAEICLADLAEVRLLEIAGFDDERSRVMYRFNPLVRLMAKADFEQLSVPAADSEAAQHRWNHAELRRLAIEIDRYDAQGPAHPAISWLANRRLDSPGVQRAIRLSHELGDSRLCWRVAARAGGCIREDVDAAASGEVFDLAIAAARKESDPLCLIDTLLAKAAFLVEVERYSSAFTVLNEVIWSARGTAPAAQNDPQLILRHAIAHRKRAEAFLQAACFAGAAGELERADKLARLCRDDVERTLLKILRAEMYHIVPTLPGLPEDDDYEAFDDLTKYRYLLLLSESERRQRNWVDAADFLDRAKRVSQFDLRREASLYYRMARLRLDQWHFEHPLPSETETEPQPLVRQAIRRATAAMCTFKRIDDPAGVIRSRIMLARAMIAANLPVEAQIECDQAEFDLRHQVGEREISSLPLQARLARARAELLLQRRDVRAAFRHFIEASKLYGQCHDWSSQTELHATLNLVRHGDLPSQSWPMDSRLADSGALHFSEADLPMLLPHQRRPIDGVVESGDPEDARHCC
jgi:hypothetical protein